MTQLNHITLKLGVIGEFNTGKSTLLNAILGKHVVATSDRPCTPVPIYIEAGSPEGLSIRNDDGSESKADLEAYSRYTTDGEAPAGIHSIHMTVQSSLLTDNRITLIDTPGINAINPVHTAITESVLPEMHAAILLMYSKPPGSKSTLEFLKNASSQMGKVFICISKADFLDDGQLTPWKACQSASPDSAG
jgi:GTPase Era involved in 16S rRNA processing